MEEEAEPEERGLTSRVVATLAGASARVSEFGASIPLDIFDLGVRRCGSHKMQTPTLSAALPIVAALRHHRTADKKQGSRAWMS
jgi:hypothetical protein